MVMVRLRALWLSINASYWFWPAVLCIVAVLASFITVALDRQGSVSRVMELHWLVPVQPDGARNILNVIAGSMIGVTATVFSITIAAVVYASGSYGPRLLNNFMEDRGNQLSLGVFLATFTYALMIIRVLRGDESGADGGAGADISQVFVPQLSVLIAVILMAVAVAVLVYFLHHIPASIRINTVLEGIGCRLIDHIRKRFPDDQADGQEEPWPEGRAIIARESGYIQLVDFARLDRIADREKCRLQLRQRTGDFVFPRMPMVDVIGADISSEMREDILACFSLGGMRTAEQDLEFLIDELAEIVLRALSPGVNDPFTALTSLYWLSAATSELASRNLRAGPDGDDYDRDRVRPLEDDFGHFLRRGMSAVRHDVAANPIVADQFLTCLTAIAGHALPGDRRTLVAHEGDLLLEQCRHCLSGPALDSMIERHRCFRDTLRDFG